MNPSSDGESIAEAPQRIPPTQPRVWTVFLTVVTALVLSVVLQGVVGIVLAVSAISNGAKPETLQNELIPRLMSPPVFMAILILGQLAMLATALVAAKFSPIPMVRRLGLAAPRFPLWANGVLVIGSALPFAISIGAVLLMTKLIEPDQSVELLYQQMTRSWAIPFIVAIGLFPGIVEEILFRGYVQRRFIDRWGPWSGIIVTSIVFAIFHVTPHAMALALILGLWLGVIAYRTGSIWPGALCHLCINSGWNVYQVGTHLWGFPKEFSPGVMTTAIVLMALAFFVAIWTLVKFTGKQPSEMASG